MLNFDLKNYGVDYLLVNSTNKFLLEYVPIEENLCHKLTGFTGEVGDALVCPDGKILLFVDSRFHIQADREVDHTIVEVVKLQLGQKIDEEIVLRVPVGATFGVVGECITQSRLDRLIAFLSILKAEIKLVDIDLPESYCGVIEDVPQCLTGRTTQEKIKSMNGNYLITQSEELSYLLNIRSFSKEYSSQVNGKLLIVDSEPILFTDFISDISRPISEFEEYISAIPMPIQVDRGSVSAKDYSLINNPVNISSPIKKMKSIKTSGEIEHFKDCFARTDKALRATRDWIYATDNITEFDIKSELENNFKKFGAKYQSFHSIVGRNENSALAHYNKTDNHTILGDSDLVLIDCGAYYEGGLATDITRVFVKGEPTQLQKKVYTTVLKTFLNAFSYEVRVNTSGFEIDKYARVVMDSNLIDGFAFSHGLGHGIGVSVHEAPPNLSKNEIAKSILEDNMCFTIEPGLYCEGFFGVRLENSCYLENGKIKSFSKMCYEKKLIEMSLLNDFEKKVLENFEVI